MNWSSLNHAALEHFNLHLELPEQQSIPKTAQKSLTARLIALVMMIVKA